MIDLVRNPLPPVTASVPRIPLRCDMSSTPGSGSYRVACHKAWPMSDMVGIVCTWRSDDSLAACTDRHHVADYHLVDH